MAVFTQAMSTPYPKKHIVDRITQILPPKFTHRAAERFHASKYREHIGRLSHKFLRFFTLHPAQTHETYLQHLWFTVKTSLRFVVIALLLFTHGIFPFLFTRTASSQIESIYRLMRSRIPQTRREAIESEYEI